MSEIHITVNGGLYRYGPGIIRIGRSSENDIVINDPTVSRRHAQVSWEAEGWVWQNLGQAPTFLGGQPVARFVVAGAVDVTLASPQGPSIRLQAVADGAQPAATGPVPTALASPGGVAMPTAPGPADYPVAAAAGVGAGGAPLTAQGAPLTAQGGPGGGYPGAPQPGYAPVAGPGTPGAAGFAPPGAPGYAGFVPGMPQLDVTKLERGSFIETLVPIKSWLHDKGWRQGLRLLIIPYALLPLIFLQIFSTAQSLTTPGWAYSLYVGPLWLIAFWYLIRPPRWGRLEIWIAVGVVIWEYIWLHVVTININDNLVRGRPAHLPQGTDRRFQRGIQQGDPGVHRRRPAARPA